MPVALLHFHAIILQSQTPKEPEKNWKYFHPLIGYFLKIADPKKLWISCFSDCTYKTIRMNCDSRDCMVYFDHISLIIVKEHS